MPFCPKCRYEYNPEISTCPDCEERLVVSLPENNNEDSEFDNLGYDNWVSIGKIISHVSANMVEEALRSKNIPVIVYSNSRSFGQASQLGVSIFGPTDGGFSIMVPKEFSDDAANEAKILLDPEYGEPLEE